MADQERRRSSREGSDPGPEQGERRRSSRTSREGSEQEQHEDEIEEGDEDQGEEDVEALHQRIGDADEWSHSASPPNVPNGGAAEPEGAAPSA